jgi:protein involved in polysaccharide export with SLBB domain
MISFLKPFQSSPTAHKWAQAIAVGLLMMTVCSLSCIRLRGRPPIQEEEEEPPVEIVQEAVPVPVVEVAEPVQRPEYRLGYGDVIAVKFFYNPQFDQTLTIRPDGRMTLPRLGEVLVAGMTPAQLDDLITEKYSEIIREPDVTVIVQQFGEEVVYVLGEVNEPGGYPLNTYGTSVLGAIALADGFKNTAKLSSVILIKLDDQGVPVPTRLNLTRAVGGSREDDPFLDGNEIIYVPSTFISQLNLFLEQFFTKLAPPLDFYLKGYDALYPDRRWGRY